MYLTVKQYLSRAEVDIRQRCIVILHNCLYCFVVIKRVIRFSIVDDHSLGCLDSKLCSSIWLRVVCRGSTMSNTSLMDKILEFIGHELRTSISSSFFWGTISND